MKIITKFKDYYDGCNYDHSIQSGIYERHTRVIPTNNWIEMSNQLISNNKDAFSLCTGVIGFCGKIYPYVYFRDGNLSYGEVKTQFIYSYEDFEPIREMLIEREGKRNRWHWHYDLLSDKKTDAENWFKGEFSEVTKSFHYTKNKKNILNLKDIFYENRVPCFAVHSRVWTDEFERKFKWKIVLNPCLKDYMFYRVFDPYTAFQEIEMFMNNQIVRPDDPPIDPVPDRIKAESHGFNKFSFRKDKSDKKS